MVLIINNQIEIVTENKSEIVINIMQKFSMQNEGIDQFLKKVEITGNLFQVKQIIDEVAEVFK